MKQQTTIRNNARPTSVLVEKLEALGDESKTCVTRAVLREIIAKRLGLLETEDFRLHQQLIEARQQMRKLTYSFDSRQKMEAYFKQFE